MYLIYFRLHSKVAGIAIELAVSFNSVIIELLPVSPVYELHFPFLFLSLAGIGSPGKKVRSDLLYCVLG